MLHNGAVIERVVDGLFAFYGVCGGALGGRAHHRAMTACGRPSCRRLRSVRWRTASRTAAPAALETAYDELAEAYGAIGANWTVWVWPDDHAAGRVLEETDDVLEHPPVTRPWARF